MWSLWVYKAYEHDDRTENDADVGGDAGGGACWRGRRRATGDALGAQFKAAFCLPAPPMPETLKG